VAQPSVAVVKVDVGDTVVVPVERRLVAAKAGCIVPGIPCEPQAGYLGQAFQGFEHERFAKVPRVLQAHLHSQAPRAAEQHLERLLQQRLELARVYPVQPFLSVRQGEIYARVDVQRYEVDAGIGRPLHSLHRSVKRRPPKLRMERAQVQFLGQVQSESDPCLPGDPLQFGGREVLGSAPGQIHVEFNKGQPQPTASSRIRGQVRQFQQ